MKNNEFGKWKSANLPSREIRNEQINKFRTRELENSQTCIALLKKMKGTELE